MTDQPNQVTTAPELQPAPDQPAGPLATHNAAPIRPYESGDAFELAQRMAKQLSVSSFVPPLFRNDISNCLIALEYANRLGASPLAVMQSLFVVHGKPGLSAAFLIAQINAAPAFRGRLRFELAGDGDDRGCLAWAVDDETGDVLSGSRVTMSTAKTEGWYGRDGSKWLAFPDQMLIYRSATFFARSYAPELMLGMSTVEEINDDQPRIQRAADDDRSIYQKAIDRQNERVRDVVRRADRGEIGDNSDGTTPKIPEPDHDARPTIAETAEVEPLAQNPGYELPKSPRDFPYLAPDGDWIDITGTIFTAGDHAWNKRLNQPSVTKSGEFRKGRPKSSPVTNPTRPPDTPATASEPEPEQTTAPAPVVTVPGVPATDPAESDGLLDGLPVPAGASATLRSLLAAVGSATDPATLNRLQNHPECSHLAPDELDFYRSAIGDRAAVIGE